MTTEIQSTRPDAPLFEGVEKMAEQGIRHVLVMEGKSLAGILSNRDLLRATMSRRGRGLDLHATTVGEVMTPAPLITVDEGTDLPSAVHLLRSHRISALPVIGAAGVVGIVTSDDLLQALAAAERVTQHPDL